MSKDTTEKQRLILQTIENLTDDDDQRQELWLLYLTGSQPETFSNQLEKIKIQYGDNIKLQEVVWQLIQSDSPAAIEVKRIIDELTPLERSIVALLMIGVDVQRISRYKSISETRIRHIIATIRSNSNWESAWRLNEISQTKKDTD